MDLIVHVWKAVSECGANFSVHFFFLKSQAIKETKDSENVFEMNLEPSVDFRETEL